MVYIKSTFKKFSIEKMAETIYGDPDLVAEFMDSGHRGEIAQYVLGDADDYVYPRQLNDVQALRLKEYLEERQYRQPAVTAQPV